MQKSMKNSLLKRLYLIKRTSFSLTKSAHEAIANIAKFEKGKLALGIEDIIGAMNELEKMGEKFDFKASLKPKTKRIRKTYAVFSYNLEWLKKRAEADNISRDLLLEAIALKMEPLIVNEDTLRAQNYLKLYEGHIQSLYKNMLKVEKIIVSELPKNDALINKYRTQVEAFGRLVVHFIKKELPDDIE